LTILLLGWGSIVAGVVAGLTLLTIAGATAVAIANLLLAKKLLEIDSSVRSIARVRQQADATDVSLRGVVTDVDGLKTRSAAVATAVTALGSELTDTRSGLTAHSESIAGVHDEISMLEAEVRRGRETSDAGMRAVVRDLQQVSTRLAELAGSHETTRSAVTATRGLTDKLAAETRARIANPDRLLAVARTDVEAPLLSVAIPSFDRPGHLRQLLTSVADEVASYPPGVVEVCITDDASPDPEAVEVALAFAEDHGYASFRTQEVNLGIERNVLAAGQPCRGEYLLLIGNDDVLVPGALGVIIEDISQTGAPVLLYEKKRINFDGTPRPDVAGSSPIGVEDGATHMFSSFVDAASRQGLLSTFGFVGPIVVRRKPFLAVDATPYLDLTMYAPTCVMVEAFSSEPVLYHNVVTILHRTETQRRKEAEALGRREHEFMIGGERRLARYYGTSLAAALQRLVDRGALDHRVLSGMTERLMTDLPLIDWIMANRSIDPTMDETLDASVVEDANRLLAAMTAHAE
jgi:hypothetical protein